jgi:hypothetical protein
MSQDGMGSRGGDVEVVTEVRFEDRCGSLLLLKMAPTETRSKTTMTNFAPASKLPHHDRIRESYHSFIRDS